MSPRKKAELSRSSKVTTVSMLDYNLHYLLRSNEK